MVFNWPENDTITVPIKPDSAVDCWMMADTKLKALQTEVTDAGLNIKMNSEFQNPYASVVVLQTTGKVVE
jgi:hypothetical protein